MAFLCTETFLTGSDGSAIDGGKTRVKAARVKAAR